MPCNASGWLDADFAAQWGIVDVDWSNAKAAWVKQSPMDCQERLVEQVKRIKERNNKTRVFVYRNIVKALPWYTDVREKLDDPRYAGWFLRFKDGVHGSYHVPPCSGAKCSEFYHDPLQSPREDGCGKGPCGEYLWDHRNDTLQQWLVDEFIMGPSGVGHPMIDGMYLDDQWTDTPHDFKPGERGPFCNGDAHGGPLEVSPNCTVDMGLAQADTTALKAGWAAANQRAMAAMTEAGAWDWHSFRTVSTPAQGATCASFLRKACEADSFWQTSAVMHEFTEPRTSPLKAWKQDMAYFLLARGPYAWLGYSWQGCVSGATAVGGDTGKWPRPAALDEDYGEPRGLCQETAEGSGIFQRQWSKARVSLDCNSWEARIDTNVNVV